MCMSSACCDFNLSLTRQERFRKNGTRFLTSDHGDSKYCHVVFEHVEFRHGKVEAGGHRSQYGCQYSAYTGSPVEIPAVVDGNIPE